MPITVVTRSNFASLLPSILHHIKEADFIAVDTELTGLTTSSQTKYFFYDEISDRYRKLRDSANSFGMLQIGLSAFKHKPSGRKYTSTTWSFHLFPAVGNAGNDFRRWTLQLSSIAFLRDNGFDFNKTFLDGIPYLSRKEEADLRGRRDPTTTAVRSSNKDIVMTTDDASFVETVVNSVKSWREGDKAAEPLHLLPCNAYQRRLLYENLPKKFGEGLVMKKATTGAGEATIVLSMPNDEQRQQEALEDAEMFEKELLDKLGFRRVWDAILALKKPLVGHNCWLDLCHIYAKLLGPLPMDFESYVQELKAAGVGPIFDTKYLASQLVQRQLLTVDGTSLSDLATAVDEESKWGVKVRVDGGKTKNKGGESFHDAGFDALCTGKVFIGVASLLAKELGKEVHILVEKLLAPVSEDSTSQLQDCIYMMQSDYESMGVVMDQARIQRHPDRNNLFVLSGIAAGMTLSDLEAALKLVGCEKTDLKIYWVDQQTAYFTCSGFSLDPPPQDIMTDESPSTTDHDAAKMQVKVQLADHSTLTLHIHPYGGWKSKGRDGGSFSKRPRQY